MTNEQKTAAMFVCLGTSIFIAGFALGGTAREAVLVKKLNSQQSLLRDAFRRLQDQVKNGVMTRDEIDEYFQEQLNFVSIITNR